MAAHPLMPPSPGALKIGDHEVDPAVDEITHAGAAVKVEPRAMRVLLYLAERPGQVISVEELLDNVWTDVVVTPDSVYTTIAALRRALGDDGKESRYIVNVPRRGYRLVAPVTPSNAPEVPPPSAVGAQAAAAPAPRERRIWVQAARATVVLALIGFLAIEKPWIVRPAAAPDAARPAPLVNDKSIAVLPFADMSEQKDQQYFADGMAEAVLELLAKVPGLTVIGRTSSFRFKGQNEDLRLIGARLGAAFVVEGSVRKAGRRVRVTAQMVDAGTGANRWSESYERDFGDILALQDEIAAGIARSLQLAIDADDPGKSRNLKSAEAYTLYLRGRLAQDQLHDLSLTEARRDFEQALALDPSFLRAAEALALTHLQLGINEDVRPHLAWKDARKAAEAALRIDPNSATAHGVLALVRAEDDFDWDGAAAEFAKAFAANPREPVILSHAALVSFQRGRYQEAQRQIDASLKLDPLNPYAQQTLGYMQFVMLDYDAAETSLRKGLAFNALSDCSHYMLGRILLLRRQRDAALKEMQAEVAPEAKDAGLAMVYHALGRKAESDAALGRLVDESGDLWPYAVAVVHAYRGDQARAFEWLDKAYDARDADLAENVRGDPEFAVLRGDPRYKALMAKMKLPE